MSWKRAWNEWKFIAVALAMCLGAFLVNASAWRSGYAGNCMGLLGCHFLRAILLLLAFAAVVGEFKATAGEGKRAVERMTLLDLPALLLIVPGCVGCYPLWAVVLLILAALFLVRLIVLVAAKDGPRLATDRRLVLRAGMAAGLFTLTWYECATVTRQALRGLGERIEARGGSEQLLAWADQVIAAQNQREQAVPVVAATAVGLLSPPMGHGPFLAAAALTTGTPGEGPRTLAHAEVPGWVDDLLGPFQGIRSIMVRTEADPRVLLFTGGSAYHFRITVRPSRVSHGSPRWWVGEVASGLEWRPGLNLDTEGK